MAEFIIHTTATATIRERWRIEADTIEQAEAIWHEFEGGVATFVDQDVAGDEEDRQFIRIEQDAAS